MIEANTLFLAEQLAVNWILQSMRKTNHQGIPHSQSILFPWYYTDAYPETSGYCIENLLDHSCFDSALNTAKWLCKIQNKDGSYYSGNKAKNPPSFFNTSQILSGLHLAFLYFKDDKMKMAADKAFDWCTSCLDSSGVPYKGLYVNHYFASYYSHALWSLIKFARRNNNSQLMNLLTKSINVLYLNENKYKHFDHCSFFPDSDLSLTHTIFYTLEGFWESSIILDRPDIQNSIITILKSWNEQIGEDGGLFSTYNQKRKKVGSGQCLTGQAQCVSLMCKVDSYLTTNQFQDCVEVILKNLLSKQYKIKQLKGSFPASYPIYGNYFPLKVVNWTQKFFLDSCKYYRNNIQQSIYKIT